MAKQYVQHISGQGEKWALHHDYTQANSHPEATAYVVENKTLGYTERRLPRCEYRLCEPPVVWKDVTEECEIDEDGVICHRGGHTTMVRNGYRRRKEKMHTPGGMREFIIIEQKVTE